MQVTIESVFNNRLVCRIANANRQIINNLRKTMMIGIPSYAIDKVAINVNKTSIIDPHLVNRLAQIPALKPYDGLVTLNVSATKNRKIYSDEFIPKDILVPDVMFFILKPGQSLNLACTIVEGYGSTHSKFERLSAFSYTENDDESFTIEMETISPYFPPEELLNKAKEIVDRLYY